MYSQLIYSPENGWIIPFQDSRSVPMTKNKINPPFALFETEEACTAHTPNIRLVSWAYYASVSKVIFHWISPCILKAKQFTFEKKISLPASFLQNPLTAWVFLATEITSDYSVKCSSGRTVCFEMLVVFNCQIFTRLRFSKKEHNVGKWVTK